LYQISLFLHLTQIKVIVSRAHQNNLG
jgi:hypothetical protein